MKTEGMVRLSCHQYKISAKNELQHWMEINVVTLHKVVEKNATANSLRNQSKRQFNEIIQCATFFFGQAVYLGLFILLV